MASDPKVAIEQALRAALAREAPQFVDTPILLERPKQAEHGDFSSNIALQLAKALRKNPRELAQALVASLQSDCFEKPEVAGPGFINFRLKASAKTEVIHTILKEGTSADRQLAVYRQTGDLRQVVNWLVSETRAGNEVTQ